MRVRRLETAEHGKTRPLYEKVFDGDSRGFVDYYYTEKTRENRIYVVEEEGQIRAMLHLNPYLLMVNGSERQTNYIVAVATEEPYRKRGYMRALLTAALRDMYEDGQCFTWLMPAAEAIYTPYGFRTICKQRREEWLAEYTGETPEEPEPAACGGIRIRPAREADPEALAAAANQALAARYRVYAVRSAGYYRRLMRECESDGGQLLVRIADGEITDCGPWYPEQPEAGGTSPRIMARILDVRRMLMTVSLKSLMAVCFQVEDPVILENNRCLVLTGTEYSGVMLMDGKPENSEGMLPVPALAELLFGVKSPAELAAEPDVRMTERMQGELEKIVPLSPVYLNETV